jgi:hypothetical protein
MQPVTKPALVQGNVVELNQPVVTVSASLFDMPEGQFQSLLQRRAKNRAFLLNTVKSTLIPDVDYGIIPSSRRGATNKPSLYKSGGEKVAALMGLSTVFKTNQSESSIMVHCELFDEHQRMVGYGCGGRDLSQDKSNGGINKTIKMSVKSAYLDAVIRAGALSDLFTLDLEDDVKPEIKPSETINVTQVQMLESLIENHKVHRERFNTWLIKLSAKNGHTINHLSQLPSTMLEEVISNLPKFANTAENLN